MAIERDAIDLAAIRTIGDIARPGDGRAADKVALICDDGAFTFGEIDRRANRAAHALIEAGIRRGQSAADIVIMCANGLDYVTAYFGAARAGAVMAHVSSRASSLELAHVLDLTGARLVITDEARYPTVEAALPEIAGPPRVIRAGAEFAAFLSSDDTDPALEIDPASPFAILFTGGTTGKPKGVVASHRARIVSAVAAAEDHPLHADDIAAVTTPLSHAAGLFTWFQPAYLVGATSVLKDHWGAGEFIEAVDQYNVTAAFMVPAQLAMLLEHPDCTPARLGSLRKIIAGGAEMPEALHARLAETPPDVDLVIAYGSTETGHLVSQQPRERAAKPGSLGRPGRHCRLEVFAGPGRKAAPGEVGEIATAGPHLFERYLGAPQETAAYFKTGDGWGWTGDLGSIDEDGTVTLAGRVKEIIISGGINIYPAEIETPLRSHPDVADCAAFGVADEKWGELPAVAVVRRDGTSVDAEALIAHASAALARFKRPRRVIFVDELPRTAGGKVQRAKLKELVSAP